MIFRGRSHHILVSFTPSYFAAQLFVSGRIMHIEHLSLTVSKCLVAILPNSENLFYCQTLDSFECVLGWNEGFLRQNLQAIQKQALSQCEVVSEALEETHLKPLQGLARMRLESRDRVWYLLISSLVVETETKTIAP